MLKKYSISDLKRSTVRPCLFSLNLSRQRHDIWNVLFIVLSHVLRREQTTEFRPFRGHYQQCKVSAVCSRRAFGRQLTWRWLFYYFAVLHRADKSQPARNSCLRLHFVDSGFGLYHVATVLRFLCSPISLAVHVI